MATRTDIAIYRGEDATITVTLAPATVITGWTLAFTVKKNFGDTTALIGKITVSGITITDATNGVFRITIASADTNNSNFPATGGEYSYDVQRTDSGSRTVLCIGKVGVLPEVNL